MLVERRIYSNTIPRWTDTFVAVDWSIYMCDGGCLFMLHSFLFHDNNYVTSG